MAQTDPVAIASAAFLEAYLSLDMATGTVRCKRLVGSGETFHLQEQGDGTVAIASAALAGVYLSMDGSGSGIVTWKHEVGPPEKFRREDRGAGTVAIASAAYPGLYLSMNAGTGAVTCRHGVGWCETFRILPAAALLNSFSLVISSDPQYWWYERQAWARMPPGLKTKAEQEQNARRQISQQYESINTLARLRNFTALHVAGVIINGDLTNAGDRHGQLDWCKELLGRLMLPYYPGLGDRDYAQPLAFFRQKSEASMLSWLYDWLQRNGDTILDCHVQVDPSQKLHAGSMAYAFNIGRLHIVQLHNYPTYKKSWRGFDIQPATDWLKADLETARNKGEMIIVNLHDYGDRFRGEPLAAFKQDLKTYGVSAVFAGHIHTECGLVDMIPNGAWPIPVYRCGSAACQDYLVADFDLKRHKLTVRKRKSWTVTADAPDGDYQFEAMTSILNGTEKGPAG